jgi:hypothetical protein
MFALLSGLGISFGLLNLARSFPSTDLTNELASTSLDVVGIALLSSCTVLVISAYTSLFRGRFSISLISLSAILLFVLTSRVAATHYARGFNFALPTVTLLALHPILVPVVVAALLVLNLAKEIILPEPTIRQRLNSAATKIAVGVCTAYVVALGCTFLVMMKNGWPS